MIILEMFHGRISLNLVLLLLQLNFVSESRLQLMCISLDARRKYQVKPHSFPCFSAACAATIAHRNHFFHLYQQNKFSTSQVKLQASNHCQNALEAVKDSRV